MHLCMMLAIFYYSAILKFSFVNLYTEQCRLDCLLDTVNIKNIFNLMLSLTEFSYVYVMLFLFSFLCNNVFMSMQMCL